MSITIAQAQPLEPSSLLDEGHGPFFPFDHLNPDVYAHNIYSLATHLINHRRGSDLPVRFKSSDGTRSLYLRFQRHDLYSCKLHVNDNRNVVYDIGDGGNLSHIGVGYGAITVGYEMFKDPVELLIRKLPQAEEKKTDKTWNYVVGHAIHSICVMLIEPLRFKPLRTDFSEFLFKPEEQNRGLTDGEKALISSWKTISRCLNNETGQNDPPREGYKMDTPITYDVVKRAKQDPVLARYFIGVRHIPDAAWREAQEDSWDLGGKIACLSI